MGVGTARRRAAQWLLATAIWSGGAGRFEAGSRAGPLPYALTVAVRPGERGGSITVREELADELAARLVAADCFAAVRLAQPEGAPAGELLAELTVTDYDEEQSFDRSLARVEARDAPPDEGPLLTYRVAASVEVSVRTFVGGAVVRSKRLLRRIAHRPAPGHDGRQEAVALWIDAIVRATRGFLCSGGAAKWQADIARARGQGAAR